MIGALYLAHYLARNAEFERAELLALAVLGRTETVARQSRTATDRLEASGGTDPCSPVHLALMRSIDLGSSYLQAVGRIENDRLLCSSLGHHGSGIPVGPVRFTSPIGDGLRPDVRLPMVPGTELLVAEHRGNATLVHPDRITGVAQGTDHPWVGVVNLSRRAPMVVRGDFRAAWYDRAPVRGNVGFIDGDRMVVLHRPAGYDFMTFAAVPRLREQVRARNLARILGPVGALVGGLFWLALRWRMRTLRSLPAVMRAALANDEFFLEYQPIVELCSGRWVGAEALLRWRRPDGTAVRPDVFIPVAEDSGLITRITERVIELVARDAPALVARHPDVRVALNLSAADLATDRTVELLRRLTQQPGLSPRNIAVEATERGLLDADTAVRVLGAIRALGIRAAIDDFGTGYSSLSYLGTFRIDTLKIDKSFVDTVGTDAPTGNVAVHIIEMAKTLGLEMVAEGVERAEQAAFLHERGVRYGQGWLYAKAMPMPALLAALDAAAGTHPSRAESAR
ncbi:MAG TPA: EAL domain-containing protein [Lysobacter sp.]